jgi:hypothetical protein
MATRYQTTGRRSGGAVGKAHSAPGKSDKLENEIDQVLDRLKDGIEQEEKALDAILSRLRGWPTVAV